MPNPETPPHQAAIRAAQKLITVYSDERISNDTLNRAAIAITREYEGVVSALREINKLVESANKNLTPTELMVQLRLIHLKSSKALQQLTKDECE